MILFIGFGRLTKGLLPFINFDQTITVFHRNEKDSSVYENYHVTFARPADFSKATSVFITLPANEYDDFFKQYGQYFQKDTTFFHMATALFHEEVTSIIGNGRVVPCKCIGQADQMVIEQKGMLAVPSSFQEERKWLQSFFSDQMKIVEGSEADVLLVNQQATKAAIEWADRFKKDLHTKGIPKEWADHSLEVTVRGVIKSFCDQQLGGFGRTILQEIEKQNEVSDHEN